MNAIEKHKESMDQKWNTDTEMRYSAKTPLRFWNNEEFFWGILDNVEKQLPKPQECQTLSPGYRIWV